MKIHSETNVITGVTLSKKWFDVRFGPMGVGVKMKYGVVPKIGDKITVHSTSVFGMVRGIDINGKTLFFKTDEELESYRIRKSEEYKQKQIDSFKKNKSNLDAQYDSLPNVFKERINRFRNNNPNFRMEFEAYEMFCCLEALKIAKAMKKSEEVKRFWEAPYDQQRSCVSDLSDGHSGNTFGCACRLAILYLDSPELVSKVNGSLSPLVGSEAFGDIHPETTK